MTYLRTKAQSALKNQEPVAWYVESGYIFNHESQAQHRSKKDGCEYHPLTTNLKSDKPVKSEK